MLRIVQKRFFRPAGIDAEMRACIRFLIEVQGMGKQGIAYC